MIKLIDVFSV